MPNLGAVRSDGHVEKGSLKFRNERTRVRTTSNNPLNPHGVGWVNLIIFLKVSIYLHMRAKFLRGPTAVSKKVSFKFSRLGVRSLANASRARQFNPLNPPGVGWVKFV